MNSTIKQDEVLGDLVYEDKFSYVSILLQCVLFLLLIIFLIFGTENNNMSLNYKLNVFLALYTLLFLYYMYLAKQVHYKIYTNGIEFLTGYFDEKVIFFNSIVWYGPSFKTFTPIIGKHKVLDWTVRWEYFGPFPYFVNYFRTWTIIYKKGNGIQALKLHASNKFILSLTSELEKQGYESVIKNM